MKIVDMHCDTMSRLWKLEAGGMKEELSVNSGHVDMEKLRKGGYLLQNFALFVEKEKCDDPWEQVLRLYGVYKEQLEANRDCLAPVLSYEDIEKNQKEGKISAMLTVEEGAVCKGEIQKLEALYEMGVRMLTLTWNYPNELGYPNLNAADPNRGLFQAPQEKGLTETGLIFLEKMEELGMIVDVSHLSDGGFYDVLAHTRKPFVASHSNARAVCPCVRNLSDDMIRKLAERGGVTGLNFCADFLAKKPAEEQYRGTVEDIVRHARHIVDTGGEDCLGLGSDFDGIDTHGELTGADKMELLWEGLKGGGFTERMLDKICSGNVLRLYEETLR